MPVPRLAKWNILRLCPRLCRSSVNVVFHKSEMPNTSPGAAGRWLFDRLYFNWLKYKLNYFQKESLENVLLFWGKRKSERGAPNSADKNFGRYRFSPMTTVKSALCMERRSTANVFLQFMNFYQKEDVMDAQVEVLLKDQVNKEFYSAYLYLAFSMPCTSRRAKATTSAPASFWNGLWPNRAKRKRAPATSSPSSICWAAMPKVCIC